jgi:hypothetical protein
MECGLVAAIGWGVSSVAATHAARRMVTLAALLASQAKEQFRQIGKSRRVNRRDRPVAARIPSERP